MKLLAFIYLSIMKFALRCLMSGYFAVYITMAQEYSIMTCKYTAMNSTKTSICWGAQQYQYLPDNIPIDTEKLVISVANSPDGEIQHGSIGTLTIKNINTFNRFTMLYNLSITIANDLYFLDSLNDPASKELLKKELFNLNRLTEFYFKFLGNHTAKNGWKLPSSLKTLTYVGGHADEFDIRECYNLEKISIEYPNQVRLPYFSNPPPPLRELILEEGSLQEVTVNDIADFCKLEKLILKDDGGPELNACECRRMAIWLWNLYLWAHETGAVFSSMSFLTCAKQYENSGGNCSDYKLEKALLKRKQCISKYLKKFPKIVVISVVFLLVLMNLMTISAWIYVRFIRDRFKMKKPASSTTEKLKQETMTNVTTETPNISG